MNSSPMENELTAFINCDKFKTYSHLQPTVENSTPETIILVNQIFTGSAVAIQQLITDKTFSEETVRPVLLSTIKSFEEAGLDTEDFEFCYELIDILSKITGISIEEEVNKQQEQILSMDSILEMIKKTGLNPKDFGL